MEESFEKYLDGKQLKVVDELNSPLKIQEFLDSVAYVSGEENRSPIKVLEVRQAHCLDGGVFAAAALSRLGYPPLILQMLPEPGLDDDHILAIFKEKGCYGAVAKSNFTGLRFREPVYRSYRELVMSYFDSYFNLDGIKTLRGYTRPVDLRSYDSRNWMGSDAAVDCLEQDMKKLRMIPVLTDEMKARLNPVDPITYKAGMLVVNQDGLFKPLRS
ncbi:MAG: hypothetical protein EHM41_08740 [Chloroflexi bacterium]|nr:MAG: hypothetical protein EHM41_08740 [Chloroflexota bacterium]